MERRTLLKLGGASIAAGGLTGLSGCMSAAGESPPPAVPEDRLAQNGWEKQEDETQEVFNESYGPVTVSATAHTLAYADTQLAADLKEKTLGAINAPANMFFASRVTFNPDIDDLPAGVGQKEINERIRTHADQSIRDRMKDSGLQDISKVGTKQLEMQTGETVDATQYEATFVYDSFSYSVKDQSITVPSGELTITGWLAVWNHDGDSLIAGGAHPAENVAFTEQKQLTEAVNITLDVDLGLTPQQYRDEILGYITSVE